jgi:hypothetical protein
MSDLPKPDISQVFAWIGRCKNTRINGDSIRIDDNILDYTVDVTTQAYRAGMVAKALQQTQAQRMNQRPASLQQKTSNTLCKTCRWFVPMTSETNPDPEVGRCRRHAPTKEGFPVVFDWDWCGDYTLKENDAPGPQLTPKPIEDTFRPLPATFTGKVEKNPIWGGLYDMGKPVDPPKEHGWYAVLKESHIDNGTQTYTTAIYFDSFGWLAVSGEPPGTALAWYGPFDERIHAMEHADKRGATRHNWKSQK